MNADRRNKILELARTEGRILTTEVATTFSISEMTARRDITWLCAEKLLVRVHGGAMIAAPTLSRSRSTLKTALVVPTSDYYFREVIRGAENVAATFGVRIILGVTNYSVENELERVAQLLELGVSGLLLTTSRGDASGLETGSWLDTLPVRTVLMERSFSYPDTQAEFDHVRTDHSYGASLAVRHLAKLGHQSIALVLLDSSPTSHWINIGYQKTVTHLDLDSAAPRADMTRAFGVERIVDEKLVSVLNDCGRTNTRAILVHDDRLACRLVEIALSRDLRIPEDLAIVAYDDEVAAFAPVPITAISPPKREMGVLGMRLLGERMNDRGGREQAVRHITLLPKLTIRQSSVLAR